MRIEFIPIPGNTDTKTVMLCEDDEAPTDGTELGTVKRNDGDEWEFKSAHLIAKGGETVPCLTMRAATIDELRKAFEVRFSAVELPSNRLENGVMQRYAEASIQGLYQLAQQTDSRSGFLAALADTLAVALVKDFSNLKAETLALFVEQVKKLITQYEADKTAQTIRADQLREILGSALGGVLGEVIQKMNPKPDEPTKH